MRVLTENLDVSVVEKQLDTKHNYGNGQIET